MSAFSTDIGTRKKRTFFTGSVTQALSEIGENKEVEKVSSEGILQIPIGKLIPHKHQSRTNFKEEDLNGLEDSIKIHGVVTPLRVMQSGDKFEIVSGERRFRAAKLAGLTHLPCIMSVGENHSVLISVLENLQRENLNLFEEGRDYLKLIELGIYSDAMEVANGLGKSKSRVYECIGYCEKIPAEIQEKLIREDKLTRQHIRSAMSNRVGEEKVKPFSLSITSRNGVLFSKVESLESIDNDFRSKLKEELNKIIGSLSL